MEENMENMTVMTGDVLDLNAYKTYGEYKAALDGELQRSAESFVRIGYLLKVARDTDILAESGYRSVNEFADKEYGLDKSQVSRFIRINDEFSENGYSDRLQEQYRSFGYAKLAMMLLLPAEINEELSGRYSKADIRALREEVDEEKEKTDIEVMLEEKDERQQDCSALGRVLYQLGKDNPEMYLEIYNAAYNTVYDDTIRPLTEKLMDVLAPAGEAIISVRIAGEGRKMLSIKGIDADPVLVDVRSGEKISCTWDKLINEIKRICPDAEDGEKAWEILYGEPFPKKEAAVAPVQPKKEQASRKVSRVTKAKKPEKTGTESEQTEQNKEQEAPAEQAEDQNGQEAAGGENEESRENETQETACADGGQTEESSADHEPADTKDGAAGGAGEDSAGGGTDGENGAGVAPVQPGEQLEGQINIQDYPQYMPDAPAGSRENGAEAAGDTERPENPEKTGTEDESAEAAGKEDSGGKIKDLDGMRRHVENQKKIIASAISLMSTFCEQGIWDGLINEAKEIITRAESAKNMEEMWNG